MTIEYISVNVYHPDWFQAFQQFDTDGSGIIEISTILSAIKIKYSYSPSMVGELGKSIKMLQACTLTPGTPGVHCIML